MEINDKAKNWIDISDYDLETAEAMLQTKRFLYVGFMCHQSVEKILKALFELIKKEEPPYTHNLNYLSELTDIYDTLSEDQKNLLSRLQPLNVRARYPGYKQKLLSELNYNICSALIEQTQEFTNWIKKKLLE